MYSAGHSSPRPRMQQGWCHLGKRRTRGARRQSGSSGSAESAIRRGRRRRRRGLRFFLFSYSLLACDLSRSWRDYVQSVSRPLSMRWRHVASSPLPSAPASVQSFWGIARTYVYNRHGISFACFPNRAVEPRHDAKTGKNPLHQKSMNFAPIATTPHHQKGNGIRRIVISRYLFNSTD